MTDDAAPLSRDVPSAMGWLVAHATWVAVALLALWLPPLLYRVAVDLSLITPPYTGFPRLMDPSTLLSSLQLILVAASVPGLHTRRRIGWTLALGALATGFADSVWGFLLDARLAGTVPALMNMRRLLSTVASGIAAVALVWTRRLYD